MRWARRAARRLPKLDADRVDAGLGRVAALAAYVVVERRLGGQQHAAGVQPMLSDLMEPPSERGPTE